MNFETKKIGSFKYYVLRYTERAFRVGFGIPTHTEGKIAVVGKELDKETNIDECVISTLVCELFFKYSNEEDRGSYIRTFMNNSALTIKMDRVERMQIPLSFLAPNLTIIPKGIYGKDECCVHFKHDLALVLHAKKEVNSVFFYLEYKISHKFEGISDVSFTVFAPCITNVPDSGVMMKGDK